MNDDMTRREYWDEVANLARSITEETLEYLEPEDQNAVRTHGFFQNDAAQEALYDRLWETIDGHQWVIYTSYNFDVMRFSSNNDYAIEHWGKESVVTESGLNTAAIAFGALYADVLEHSDFGVVNDGD